MSATVRTVFGMSSSPAHRLDCYGQVEVNFSWSTRSVSSGESAKSGLSRPDERPNGGRTLGAGGYANHIGGAKNGTPATHPLSGREMRELNRHQRESAQSPFVFVSERGAPLSAPGFSRMIERAAIVADLGIKEHAHMLRHACGYKLANDGHDTRAIQAYLGHRNIQNTTRYTALAPQRFKEFFRD